MPIPPPRPDGTLPPGAYDATLDEVIAAYPPTTPWRQELNAALAGFVAAARRLGIVQRLAIGGSYITAKADPSDLDIVVLTPGIYQQVGEQRSGAEGVDLVLLDVQFGHDLWEFEQWADFFSLARDMTPKGTIHLIL